MHDGGWMTFGLGLGHWGFGLVIWVAVIIGVIWAIKSVSGSNDD